MYLYLSFFCRTCCICFRNSENPDQTPRSASSDLSSALFAFVPYLGREAGARRYLLMPFMLRTYKPRHIEQCEPHGTCM